MAFLRLRSRVAVSLRTLKPRSQQLRRMKMWSRDVDVVVDDFDAWILRVCGPPSSDCNDALLQMNGVGGDLMPASLVRCKQLLQHGCNLEIQWNANTARLGVGYNLCYTRLQHSIAVSRLAGVWCDAHEAHKYDPLLRVALRLAALFHDVGHLALSHFGDFVARSIASQRADGALIVPHEMRSMVECSRFISSYAEHCEHTRASLGGNAKKDNFRRHHAIMHLKRLATCLINPGGVGPGIFVTAATSLLQGHAFESLSSTTTDRMDIDRCAYLAWDAPPQLQPAVRSAVQAWITTDCPRAERFLCDTRAALHRHVYEASNARMAERWKRVLHSKDNKTATATAAALYRDALQHNLPQLVDKDFSDWGMRNATIVAKPWF